MKEYKDPEVLENLYWGKGMSMSEMADALNCGTSTIDRWMKRHNIDSRDYTKHASVVYATYSANPYTQIRYRTDRVYEHRLLAVAKYGFDHVVDKDVHHKNRIPWDNRESNIEVMDPSEHKSFHASKTSKEEAV